MKTNLVPPVTLCANPNAYDYIHSVQLLASNAIEFLAGDGQKIWFKASGNFYLTQQKNEIQIHFFNLIRVEPNDKDSLTHKLLDFECSATIEYGQYILPDGLPHVQRPETRQFLLFNRRVVFETDPILLADRENEAAVPVTDDATERIYYPIDECECGTMAQLTRPRLILPTE